MLLLLSACGAFSCEDPTVTVAFAGELATISGTPMGLSDSDRTAAATGSFTYDTCTAGLEEIEGRKLFDGALTDFELDLAGVTVTGSQNGIVEIEDMGSDTLRFVDGPQLGDPVIRTMQLDGQDSESLELWFAITDDDGASYDSTDLPVPFPMDPALPHTFSLSDDGGTALLQLDSLE